MQYQPNGRSHTVHSADYQVNQASCLGDSARQPESETHLAPDDLWRQDVPRRTQGSHLPRDLWHRPSGRVRSDSEDSERANREGECLVQPGRSGSHGLRLRSTPRCRERQVAQGVGVPLRRGRMRRDGETGQCLTVQGQGGTGSRRNKQWTLERITRK